MKDDYLDILKGGDNVIKKSQHMNGRDLLTSLGVSASICAAYIIIFALLRRRVRPVYEPRTFLPPSHSTRVTQSDSMFSWFINVVKTKDKELLPSIGLDAYFFLRYILMLMVLCGAIALPFLVVLLPIHLNGRMEGVRGLDRLSTMSLSQEQILWNNAHLGLSVISTLASALYLKAEMMRYFRIRSNYMHGRQTSQRCANTLLLKGLDKDETEENIRALFTNIQIDASGIPVPPVKKIWLNKDYSILHTLVAKRSRIIDKLEELELWLTDRALHSTASEESDIFLDSNKLCLVVGNLWRSYLSGEDYEQMHSGARGSLLMWLKGELNKLNSEIYQMQNDDSAFPRCDSCFVQFDSSQSAYIASRALFSRGKSISDKVLFDRVCPSDIIWSNLVATSRFQHFSAILATTLNYLFIFGWAVPVAAISLITQAEEISYWIPSVRWILETPYISKVMSSVLSPLIVATLTSMVPTIFRLLALWKGYPTYTRVEMDVQRYLFLFMFFQLFLIATLATGLPSLLLTIVVNTSEGAIVFADSLPKATTFFISYLVATSLTTAGGALVQLPYLFVHAWFSSLEKTPRQRFRNMIRRTSLSWGTMYPTIAHIGAIAMAYALISPIILPAAVIGLAVLYTAFKYRVVYCYVPSPGSDGDFYPQALIQLFTGIHCQQVALFGTLLVSHQFISSVCAAVLIIVTALVHIHLDIMFRDLNTRIFVETPQTTILQCGLDDLVSDNVENSSEQLGNSAQHPSWLEDLTPVDPGPSSTKLSDCVEGEGDGARVASFSGRLSEVPLTDDTEEQMSPESMETISDFSILRNSMRVPRSPRPLASMVTNEPDEMVLASSGSIGECISSLQDNRGDVVQDTWASFFQAWAWDFAELNSEQREHYNSIMFDHPDKRQLWPCVWLARDWKGVAQDQVIEMQTCYRHLRSSCNGCDMRERGKIVIYQPPPDFDMFDLLTAW